jgi:hypothetical protein
MAQVFTPGESHQWTIFKSATVNLASITNDYYPVLFSSEDEMPKPGSESYYEQIEEVRKGNGFLENRGKNYKTDLFQPIRWNNFKGNKYAGIPNDNDIAVSNNGTVVSVTNSLINVYDSAGNLLKSSSLAAFTDQIKHPQAKYDPRVLYDPEQDRFVFCCLNGQNDSTSFIYLGFSTTNNPLDNWNFYNLSGNPFNDSTWSDYPIIALYKDCMVLTLNQLQNNKTWQEGFKQSFIWQISKTDGFDGKALTVKLINDMKFNSKPIRNLCPVQGASGLTSSDKMYFLSDRNFNTQSDSFFLYELNSKINESEFQLKLSLLKTNNKAEYGVPPKARQKFRANLETNDARILDAVIANNEIHAVGNTINFSDGHAAFFHLIISDPDKSAAKCNLDIIGNEKLDYGYPAIAYAGKMPGNSNYLILVNYSSDTAFLGNGSIFYSDGSYSPLTILKPGETFISLIGTYERWGDYSGAQTRYNKPGEVWVGGTFGIKEKIDLMTYQVYGTWISQIINPYSNLASVKFKNVNTEKFVIYPQPTIASNKIYVKFIVRSSAYLHFQVYDINGKLIKTLLSDKVSKGENIFSFDSSCLKSGTYVLRITSDNDINYTSQKFEVTQ